MAACAEERTPLFVMVFRLNPGATEGSLIAPPNNARLNGDVAEGVRLKDCGHSAFARRIDCSP